MLNRQFLATRRLRGDDGMVLIFVALLMVAMLLVTALVIDLSVVRSTRQTNKSAADFAVTAGLHGLNNTTGIPQPWQGVCQAIDYLKANKSGMSGITTDATYTDGTGAAVSNPCANTSGVTYRTLCSPTDHRTWASFSGTSNGVEVDIKSGYVVPDLAFAEDSTPSYVTDVGDPAQLGCDQLAVIIREIDPSSFGRVGGKASYTTTIRSVGRVTIGSADGNVIALLLLERSACDALYTHGNNTVVRVLNGGVTGIDNGNSSKQGFIHTNSDASNSNCNGAARVFHGSIYNPTGGPSIIAEDSTDGTHKGRISNLAVGGPNAAFSTTPSCPNWAAPTAGCTVAPDPVLGSIIGRGVVDDRYLGLGSPSTRLTKLQTDASTRYNATTAPTGYVAIGCPNGTTTVNSATAGGPKVYMNCDLSPGPNDTITFDSSITDVIVHGNINTKGSLVFDDVRSLYVSGNVSDTSTLSVNAGGQPDCTTREASNPDHVTNMVVGGNLTATSAGTVIRLCNTFAFLGSRNPLPTTRDTVPKTDTSLVGKLDLSSSTTVDWKAPNQSNAILDDSDPLYDQFEDLALWTEYSGDCNNSGPQLGGQSEVTASGVFFLPNACPFTINGGGNGAIITADAQFIVRQLSLQGTVGLTMRPNPANALSFPVFEGYSLVR